MGKQKIKTSASSGAARFTDDGSGGGAVERGPTEEGNVFDVRMASEADGVVAARKIVGVLKEKGVCLVEANAPHELLAAAYDEAEQLWEDGHFGPPMKVYDDRSMMEAQLWDSALSDEQKVHWIRESESKPSHSKNALKLLSRNIADFGAGLGDFLKRETGIEYDRHGHTMLSCYTGDKQYRLHIDNPHACDPERDIPDAGMRLSATYYINPHWDPSEGFNGGGLDLHLSDPKTVPSSASAARSSPKLRVAPHADSLVLYLSERIAHQVLPTKGGAKWFCMNMWFMNGKAMAEVPRKLAELRSKGAKDGDSDDEDGPS